MNAPVAALAAPVRLFTQRFSPTRRGVRLARHLAALRLHDWGVPLDTGPSYAASVVIAELASNAIAHGYVQGRDFELRMVLLPATRTLRVEVSDARADRRPRLRADSARAGAEGGYGMLLVEEFARAWGVAERCVGKTVWAEVTMPAYCSVVTSDVTPGCR